MSEKFLNPPLPRLNLVETRMRPPELHPLLRDRFSARSYQEKAVSPETIRTLFEAAHWAPSCFNEQPWRFAVASKAVDPAAFERLASTLVAGNAWALEAPVLGIAFANLRFARNGKDNRWGAYDTGQALAHLTIQAQALGLNVHQMGGFDATKALEVLAVPDGHEAMAAFAIGYAAESEAPASSRRDFHSMFFGDVPWPR